jgi:SnoaL-like domain
MDPTAFREYLREFNAANYAALVRYYADDVIFSFGHGPTLRGRDAVVAFYRPFHEHVKETVEIQFLLMDHRHVAVELAAEFRALKDFANFTRGPLKAGDVVRITSFVHYDLNGAGRFSAIRIGSYG